MIISFSKKFIFMHSRKTAGSTLTAALNQYIGSEDIQLGAWPDTIEAGGRYNNIARRIAMQNLRWIIWPSIKTSINKGKFFLDPYIVNEVMRRYYYNQGLRAGAHSSAKDVQAFDPEIWEASYKFCFVRNPWSHAVSDYYWRRHVRRANSISFKEFLLRLRDNDRPDPERIRPPIRTNWSIYTISDSLAIDYVARFENLESELELISRSLGFNINIKKIRSKGNIRDKKIILSNIYNEECIEIVREIYSDEIEAFNYKLPF